MMAVAAPAGTDGRPSMPKPLFAFKDSELRFFAAPGAGYCVAPDGRSFYTTQVIPTPPPPPVTHIHLILNWLEEVKAKLSERK